MCVIDEQARKLVLVDKASQKAERRQNKRNPEAILHKRAKKRAKYIAKLVEEGGLLLSMSFENVKRRSSGIGNSK